MELHLNVWFALLLGHLLGDYVFQNSWMAEYKKLNTYEGFLACLTHCTIYTSIILITLCCSQHFIQLATKHKILSKNSIFIILYISIFFSHWILDRTHFVEKYAKMMEIRIWNSHINLDNIESSSFNKLESIRLSFGVFVYILLDNTLHLLFMTIILTQIF